MITRPTTDVLIGDCCRELIEAILPGLTDETLKLRLVMAETVLRNAAVRAAHEIAWMREETAELLAFAEQVAARYDSEPLRVALAAGPVQADPAQAGRAQAGRAQAGRAQAGSAGSLHLADVAEHYGRAGQAFTAALAAAQEAGAADLVARARDLLRNRIATEQQVMASYQVVGR